MNKNVLIFGSFITLLLLYGCNNQDVANEYTDTDKDTAATTKQSYECPLEELLTNYDSTIINSGSKSKFEIGGKIVGNINWFLKNIEGTVNTNYEKETLEDISTIISAKGMKYTSSEILAHNIITKSICAKYYLAIHNFDEQSPERLKAIKAVGLKIDEYIDLLLLHLNQSSEHSMKVEYNKKYYIYDRTKKKFAVSNNKDYGKIIGSYDPSLHCKVYAIDKKGNTYHSRLKSNQFVIDSISEVGNEIFLYFACDGLPLQKKNYILNTVTYVTLSVPLQENLR